MKIIICADDYALSPGVSLGIRQALAAGRISATSVMPLHPFWPFEAEALKLYADKADIGLHITLTDQTPLGSLPLLAPNNRFPTQSQLIAQAQSGSLPLNEIEQEIHLQFDFFEQALGFPPDHVDGHHYIHHLPGIREIVTETILTRAPYAYVRSCFTDPDTIFQRGVGIDKALSLNAREQGFCKLLQEKGISCNRGFAGVYEFIKQEPYEAVFPRFLEGINPGALLVCHPGRVDDTLLNRDSLTWKREEELVWLLGDEFAGLLSTKNIQPARFKHLI